MPETSELNAAQSLMRELLVCPRDQQDLRSAGAGLVCERGHGYAVIEGIPILLVSDAEQTHIEGARALAVAESGDASSLPKFNVGANEIDPFVRNAIGATNGGLYQHLVGTLTEYPIPRLRLPPGENKLFLEVGCNWGRWCIAAARLGYRPVGIDPSLKSIRAANRVARQLGIEASYVVADGRYLPFREQSFDQIFSYSVLQHLSKENALTTLSEIRRALRPGSSALVQMPNVFGVRCLYHQMRRGFREARDFEVRYWRPAELLSAFMDKIGPSELSVDGYFSLNVQPSDLRLLPVRYRALVHASEGLRRISGKIPILTKVADSLYVNARRTD
jgi:SAM-dependent methyltransferase